jgi:hypothetical protein
VTSWSSKGGMFSLSSPGVPQVGVEMLNRCPQNDHYWIAIATTTNKPFDIIVEDTQSGVTRSFPNPLLVPPKAAAVVDTSAFATCP